MYYVILLLLPSVSMLVLPGFLFDMVIKGVFFVGLFMFVMLIWQSMFRQHKDGIFSQWTDPGAIVHMSLDKREKKMFKMAVSIIVGGGIAIVLAILFGKFT